MFGVTVQHWRGGMTAARGLLAVLPGRAEFRLAIELVEGYQWPLLEQIDDRSDEEGEEPSHGERYQNKVEVRESQDEHGHGTDNQAYVRY